MNPTLHRLCQLIDSENREVSRAALLVLREIQPKDASFVRWVKERLKKASFEVKLELLELIRRSPSVGYLTVLSECLGEGGSVRDRAGECLLRIGPKAIPLILKRYPRVSREEQQALVRLLARMRHPRALRFLLGTLKGSDLEHAKSVSFSLKEAFSGAEKEKPEASREVLQFLKGLRSEKDSIAVSSALVLLGHLGDVKAKKAVLKFVSSANPHVRRQAIKALARLPWQGRRGDDDVVRSLLPLLKERLDPDVTEAALETLKKLPIGSRHEKILTELLKQPWPAVRSFALNKLGEVGGRAVVRQLLEHLEVPDPRIQEASLKALAHRADAVPELVRRIEETSDVKKAEQLAFLLKAHRSRIGRPKLLSFARGFEKALEKQDGRTQVYLAVLRTLDPDLLYEVVHRRLLRFKKRKQWEEVIRTIRVIEETLLFTPELRCELATALLKASKKPKGDPSRRERALSLFESLVRNAPRDAFSRIKKERALEPEDLLEIGKFLLSRLYETKECGRELLQYVGKRFARKRAGTSARRELARLA